MVECFFCLHGEPVLVADRDAEDGFLRQLEADAEVEYDSEREGLVVEDIGEGLNPNEDPMDDLIDVRDAGSDCEESGEEDPDEDLIEEEEEHLVVEPAIEKEGPTQHPIVEDDQEFIDWDDVLLHIEDGPPADWDDEDQVDGPADEEEGNLENPVVEDEDDVMLEDSEEGLGLDHFEDPIWDFPAEGEHDEEGPGEPEVIDLTEEEVGEEEVQEEDLVEDLLDQAQFQVHVARAVADHFCQELEAERRKTECLRT